VVVTDGNVVVTDGIVVVTDGNVVVTDGIVVVTDGNVVVTDGIVVVTDGNVVVVCEETVPVNAKFADSPVDEVAVIVALNPPATDGVPVISPVFGLMLNPVGRLTADQVIVPIMFVEGEIVEIAVPVVNERLFEATVADAVCAAAVPATTEAPI
jgi:hypothetical protein